MVYYLFNDKVFVCLEHVASIYRVVYSLPAYFLMIKNEQLRDINQYMRTISTAHTVSLQPSLQPSTQPAPMLQTTSGILSQRLIDSNAIDITSLKGQFAWEKIPHSDAYVPVIFRYVNMNTPLQNFKLLHT